MYCCWCASIRGGTKETRQREKRDESIYRSTAVSGSWRRARWEILRPTAAGGVSSGTRTTAAAVTAAAAVHSSVMCTAIFITTITYCCSSRCLVDYCCCVCTLRTSAWSLPRLYTTSITTTPNNFALSVDNARRVKNISIYNSNTAAGTAVAATRAGYWAATPPLAGQHNTRQAFRLLRLSYIYIHVVWYTCVLVIYLDETILYEYVINTRHGTQAEPVRCFTFCAFVHVFQHSFLHGSIFLLLYFSRTGPEPTQIAVLLLSYYVMYCRPYHKQQRRHDGVG